MKTEPTLVDKAREKLTHEVEALPVMQIDANRLKSSIHVDSLMAMADIRSVDRADSLKTAIENRIEDWNRFYENFKPQNDLNAIRSDLEKIDLEKIDNIPQLIVALETVQKRTQTLQFPQGYGELALRKASV